ERLAGWGLEVPAEAAPVILVDRGTLRNLLRRTGHPGGPNVNGFTSVLTEKRGNQIVKREMAVYVLFGMPREIFEGTVAHELTHVWVNLHNGRRLDPAFEEGSCNYVKYLIHDQSESELAPFAIKSMQQDQDPSYGAGFRRAKNLVERKGLDTLLTLLGRSTGFPLGY
ncbi:MAG TPA: protein DA1, partial [Stenomitos sp.]